MLTLKDELGLILRKYGLAAVLDEAADSIYNFCQDENSCEECDRMVQLLEEATEIARQHQTQI